MKTKPKKKTKSLGQVKRTANGFEIIEFKDRYERKCSLQASSLADYEKPGISAVWLGIDDAEPKVMAKEAPAYGIKTDATVGWVPYPIPPSVSLTTRVHLDRKQVASLIVTLENWLEFGTFKNV